MFAEVQGVVSPITSKLYGGGGPESHGPGSDDEEFGRSHDEL